MQGIISHMHPPPPPPHDMYAQSDSAPPPPDTCRFTDTLLFFCLRRSGDIEPQSYLSRHVLQLDPSPGIVEVLPLQGTVAL